MKRDASDEEGSEVTEGPRRKTQEEIDEDFRRATRRSGRRAPQEPARGDGTKAPTTPPAPPSRGAGPRPKRELEFTWGDIEQALQAQVNEEKRREEAAKLPERVKAVLRAARRPLTAREIWLVLRKDKYGMPHVRFPQVVMALTDLLATGEVSIAGRRAPGEGGGRPPRAYVLAKAK